MTEDRDVSAQPEGEEYDALPEPSPGNGYEVGYKKPPKHTQFQPGRSGNPHGRPKVSKNLADITRQVIDQEIRVVENGKPRLISKFEAYVTQLMNKAIAGSVLAGRELRSLMDQFKIRPEMADDGRLVVVMEE